MTLKRLQEAAASSLSRAALLRPSAMQHAVLRRLAVSGSGTRLASAREPAEQQLIAASRAAGAARPGQWQCSTHSRRLQHTSTTAASSQNDVTWLFPVSARTVRLAAAERQRHLTVCHELLIKSSKPLPNDVFEETFHHLIRKLPPLQVCLRQQHSQLWMCQLKKPKLDFAEVHGSLDSELSLLSTTLFDTSQGPLWRARLLPPLHPGPPYQRQLLLSFHHGAFDGVSVCSIGSHLSRLLGDVLSSNPIDDAHLGRMTSPVQTEQLERVIQEQLERDPTKLDSLLRQLEHETGTFSPLLTEAFGSYDVSQPSSELEHIIDGCLMNRFQAQCRAAGVTLHSAVTAALDFALVGVVRKAGLVRPTYNITSKHAIDLRRYWSGTTVDIGCHVDNINHTREVEIGGQNHFWQHATKFNEKFKELLENKSLFQGSILSKMSLPQDLSYDSYYSSKNPPDCDLYVSLLPVRSGYLYKSAFVEISPGRCKFNITNCPFPILHTMYKSGENYIYSITFSPQYLTRDTAQECMQEVVRVVRSVC